MELAEHLLALETDLLLQSTRKDAERVSLLLSEEFREFGSSGRVYSKADILRLLQEEAPASISLSDFEVLLLAPGVAHVTYRSVRREPGHQPVSALRSSLWRREGDTWRMLFHQGTRLPESA